LHSFELGPIKSNLHGVVETGVGPGADLGDASDGAWHDDLLESNPDRTIKSCDPSNSRHYGAPERVQPALGDEQHPGFASLMTDGEVFGRLRPDREANSGDQIQRLAITT
jgi:hypothetical protein